ncbi:hypothetical protein ACOMHN_042883 [Nucella lapillus]
MSTATKTTTPAPDKSSGSAGNSRRSQVMVGDLPADFLRADHRQVRAEHGQVLEDQRITQVLQAQQQAGFVQALPANVNVQGRLSISIVQARLNKSYGLTKMDPYCRVRLGHTVFETQTAVNGAKAPHWNKTFQTYLPNGVESFYLEIFDERSFTLDDRVAWGVIPIPRSVTSRETVDEWFNLSGRLGDGLEGSVNIVMSLAPASSLPQMSYMSTYTAPMMMPMYYPTPVISHPARQPVVYGAQPGMVPQQQPPPLQQQPPPPRITEEDLKQVKDMFPNMDDEVISSVLEANRGNKDAAVNSLLAMSAE